MSADTSLLPCRSCGEERPLEEYRHFRDDLRMDFCVWCERAEGTVTLYRRFSGYGTVEISSAVFSAERTPEARRTSEQVRLLIKPAPKDQPKTRAALLERELQRRELCRRSLVYFTTTFDPTYTPGWVHHDMARRLERFMHAVEQGLSPRLMIFMPPRTGKSMLASDMFPSWMLGHHPDWPIINASYGVDLPTGFSRKIRDRLKDPEYHAVFESTRLRNDTQGVGEWLTTKGGGFLAAGVGVGITGKGFKVGIVDDPIKDQAEAQSETIRDGVWDWWQSVFRTRAAPGAGIILIMTRWHDMDPAGRLLEAEKNLRNAGVPESQIESWEVVSYPALAQHDEYLMNDGSIRMLDSPPDEGTYKRLLRKAGEALHPERYSTNELLKLKHITANDIWSALYQQNPTPDDGDFFKRSDFRYRTVNPELIQTSKFITVDYAIKKSDRNNWTVMGVHTVLPNRELVTLEVRRGRWQSPDIIKNAVELVDKWRPDTYAGEQGQIHAAVWPLIAEELEKKGLFVVVDDSLQPVQDKESRARPLQARMSSGKVVFAFVANSSPTMAEEVEHELLRFPKGAHDDIVDMFAWAARLAQKMTPADDTPIVEKPKSWQDELDELLAGDGGTFMAA